MKKIKQFLNQWVLFEILDTETKGVYEIHAGVSKDGQEVELSLEAFDIFFVESNKFTRKHIEYGFKSIYELKMAAITALYFIALLKAQEIVAQHIVNSFRNESSSKEINLKSHIYEGQATGDPIKWSIFMDIRNIK